MFNQSKLPDSMIARPPRTVYDMEEGEIAYVHPDHLLADVSLYLWLNLDATAHPRPHPNWGDRYLVVQIVAGGVRVDHPDNFNLRLIPRPTPSDHYRSHHNFYIPVMLGEIDESATGATAQEDKP